MRSTHPRNSRELSQTIRRREQSCRFAHRFRASRHPHHPNPILSGLNPKALTERNSRNLVRSVPSRTEVSSRLSRSAVGPERSEVEGPAVHIRIIEPEWKRHLPLCHPERSRGICSSTARSWKCFRPQPHPAPSISFHSASESCPFAAAIFSSKCFTEEVPGIEIIPGE